MTGRVVGRPTLSRRVAPDASPGWGKEVVPALRILVLSLVEVARLLAICALVTIAAAPALGSAADDVYSYVDADGVIHVTNVPQDRRYHRAGTLGRPKAA